MNVDIGNALASVASPGVSRKSLERLDEQVAAAPTSASSAEWQTRNTATRR